MIADDVVLGANVRLSSYINLYGCRIGDGTMIGAFVEIQRGAVVGERCKISSHSFICEGVTIEDECFIGHGVMFTNDRSPGAVRPDGSPQTSDDWEMIPTRVEPRRIDRVRSNDSTRSHGWAGLARGRRSGGDPRRTSPGNRCRQPRPYHSYRAHRPAGEHHMTVPFLDLVEHHRPFRQEILDAFAGIVDSAYFVNGPHVKAFEQAFARAHEVEHALAVSNGTTALELALRGLGLGAGDRIVVPANTFIATAEAVSNVGATPVLVDCDASTRNISVEAVEAALGKGDLQAVIAVHLYGQPAEMDALRALTEAHGIPLIEDAAQAHLAEYRGRKVGGLGTVAGFSFYPGKNLGALGEGGAVTTNDDDLAKRLQMLRDHGQAAKYRSEVIGTNARMSELVGAGLEIELPHLASWTDARRRVAAQYRSRLGGVAGIELPSEADDLRSVYHLYVVHLKDRDQVQGALGNAGIGTGLHYPIPIHLQDAYRELGHAAGSFPNAEWSASHLLSLPMFPELSEEHVDEVCRRAPRRRCCGEQVTESESRRVVVTGGAGFIGSHLVDTLVRENIGKVTVVDDLSTGDLGNLEDVADRVELVVGDCADADVAAVASDADLVFHLAVRNVRASIGDPRENLRVNANGTLEMLEAMRNGRRGRFVYVSSSEIYGVARSGVFSEDTVPEPTTVYGAGKLAGELITLAYYRTYGMPTTVVRPFNNYGPRSHFEGDSGEVIPKFILRSLASKPLHVHGAGDQTRDFMYVEDTAAWLIDLALNDRTVGETLNIGYGTEKTVNELAELILAETGSSAAVEYGPARPGDLPRLLADVGRVRGFSDYQPEVGFEEGLRRTIDYFRSLGDPVTLLEREQERNWT